MSRRTLSRRDTPLWPTVVFDTCPDFKAVLVSAGEAQKSSCLARDEGRACERRGMCVEARVAQTYAVVDHFTFTKRS